MKGLVLTVAVSAILATSGAMAEESIGHQEFMIACAGCHGETAKGDGPLAGLLNIDTPDLTTLSESKGAGEFPFQYAVWVIDGREIRSAHGNEMPVWGDRYQSSATSQRGETAEMVARGRILSLVYYIESIQQ